MANINALTEIFTILPFLDNQSPAANARFADFLILHWSLQNNTDGPIELNFPQDLIFDLQVSKLDGTVVWSHPGQTSAVDLHAIVDVGSSFDIPQENEAKEERIPRVPLKTVIDDNHIADAEDLIVKFIPLIEGSKINVNASRLWR